MMGHQRLSSMIEGHPIRLAGTLLVAVFSLAIWSGCDETVTADQLANLLGGAADSPAASSTARLGAAEGDQTEVEPQGVVEPGDPGDPGGPGPDGPPCIGPLADLTRMCVEQTFEMAGGCIERITMLFQNGHFEEAHEAARFCVDQISEHTEQCLGALAEGCEQCVQELIQNGAPIEAIEAVLRACREFAGNILGARREAVGAVEDAVDRGVAHSCAEFAREVGRACAEENGAIAAECSAEIEALLAEGRIEEAEELARGCIHEIRQHSVGCAREIQERTGHCLRRLHRHCANPDLLRLVIEAREDGIRMIFMSAHEAIRHIRELFPPPPPPVEPGDGPVVGDGGA